MVGLASRSAHNIQVVLNLNLVWWIYGDDVHREKVLPLKQGQAVKVISPDMASVHKTM